MTRHILALAILAACGGEPAAAPIAAPFPSALAARAVVDTGPAVAQAVPDDAPAVAIAVDSSEEVELEPAAPEATAWSPEAQVTTWTVRRGETLAHFARWSERPVEEVAESSGLALDSPLVVGTQVYVPGGETVRGRVERARDAHHRRRAHGYLTSRGGSLGNDFYVVRTGDTAWSVARDEVGVPVWLIETYNPSVDLDALRPGQRLMVPIIADVVVDAEPPPGEATPGSSEAP